MTKKVFGYPEFDASGEKILTTYDNEYSDMLMDIRVYKMKAGEERTFCREGEEVAVLLLSGKITYIFDGQEKAVTRKDVFTEGPWCVHVCGGTKVIVKADADAEILVQCTKNDKQFPAKLYAPEDAPWGYSCVGKFGNVAKRRVNTIFDHDIAPYSNMVLGEVLNDRGNWSGYLPHRHPQRRIRRKLRRRPGIQEHGRQLLRYPWRRTPSAGSSSWLPDVYLLDDTPPRRQSLAPDGPLRRRTLRLAARR